MIAGMTFTQARARFTEVVDRAQRFDLPVIRPRKSSEDFSLVLRADFLKALLDKDMAAEFRCESYEEKDGSITITADPFDVAVNGTTREEAVAAAVEDVIDYAREYLDPDNFPLYFRSANRRSHLVLVTKIMLCESHEQIQELLGLA